MFSVLALAGLSDCRKVIPTPQSCTPHAGVADLGGWPVGLRANSVASLTFAATELANATHSTVVDTGALGDLPAVALGLPAEDPILAARASVLSLTPPDNDEGYALDVSATGVVLVARAPAGVGSHHCVGTHSRRGLPPLCMCHARHRSLDPSYSRV